MEFQANTEKEESWKALHFHSSPRDFLILTMTRHRACLPQVESSHQFPRPLTVLGAEEVTPFFSASLWGPHYLPFSKCPASASLSVLFLQNGPQSSEVCILHF